MPADSRDTADPGEKSRRLAIAPSARRLLTFLGPFALAMVVLGGIVIARHGTTAEVWISAALIVAAVGVVTFISFWARRTRMFVSTDEVGYVNFLGRTTAFPLKDVRRVMERQVMIGGPRPASMVYLLGASNRVLLQLNRRIWGADLDQFLKRLGRSIEKDPTPIKANDLMRQLQGSRKD